MFSYEHKYSQEKGEFLKPVSECPIHLLWERSYLVWWTVVQPSVFIEYLSKPTCYAQLLFISSVGCSSPLALRLPCTYGILQLDHSKWPAYSLSFLFTNKVMVTRDRITNHRNSHPLVFENPNEINDTNFQHTFKKKTSGAGLLTVDLLDHLCLNTNKFREIPKLPWRLLARAAGKCTWQLRSPDTTAFDYYLGRHMKNLVYETKSQVVAELPWCRSEMMVSCFIEKLVLF
jgi:hypothetical protein